MTPEMQSSGVRYSGTKTLTAWPMTRGEYNAYRTWTPPEGEDQTTAGYLVEYADGGQPNDSRHAGYISWSPADVFERTYRPIGSMGGMSFGGALIALKAGMRVARAGWNGKDMWLSLSGDAPREILAGQFWSPHNSAYAANRGGAAKVLPCITMKTATGEILMGWLASQTDMLADDWAVLSA